MTNEARAEPSNILLELCHARRNSTKSNDTWARRRGSAAFAKLESAAKRLYILYRIIIYYNI